MSDDDREEPSNVRGLKSIPGGKPDLPPELERITELMPALKEILESFGMPRTPKPEEARAREEHAAWERFVIAILKSGPSSIGTVIASADTLLEEWKKRRPA